jgi:hypothetical protein
MIRRRDDIPGIDDFLAQQALARRGLQRLVAEGTLCGRLFSHPCQPTEFDALGDRMTVTCVCLRPSGHDRGCSCEHDLERLVYGVDNEGREHYATRPLEGRR